MKNIFRELLDKERQLAEMSNELSQTKELLNFSLEKQDELEKEIKGLKQEFIDTLEEIEKPLYENSYNRLEVKVRKIKELINDIKKGISTKW